MDLKAKAIRFIVLMGIVSLLADMTYEGARSIIGPYLGILGASGAAVGTVAGFGEFIGSGFRILSGYISDKTKQYWAITFIGYAINLLAVPLLALAGNWPIAASLIIAERFGKAVRTPARDAMLSYATKQTGRGWGFGLHEALDQIGAITGPLIVATVFYFSDSYRMSFALLMIPALLALSVLVLSRILNPNPEHLEPESDQQQHPKFTQPYWLYLVAISLVAAGYIDFPLISYHFEQSHAVTEEWTPILYAIAMGVDGIAALILGRLFDKHGVSTLAFVAAIAAFFAPLIFLGGFTSIVIGMVLWGIGIGAQESIMRAIVPSLIGTNKRGTAYGLLNGWFGLAWFLGSAVAGELYDISIPLLVAFSFILQLASVPFFILLKKRV